LKRRAGRDTLVRSGLRHVRHPIVDDELALLDRVSALLAALPERSRAAEAPLERELERLRDVLLSGDEEKDAASLRQQWHRNAALLRQLRESGTAPRVDPRSPYFAHLRLRDARGERDLCLGRATCVDGGVRIVDWRNAPISRLFYRYQQGDAYEEEFGGRHHVGEVVARRSVGIRDGALDRIEAPEGIFASDARAEGGWRRLEREVPRLAGGEARALRAHAVGREAGHRLGVGPGQARPRSDKHLPEITGLIDPAQFGLITRPQAGFLAIRGSAGSGKTTVALHRIAYLAFHDPLVDSARTLFLTLAPGLRNYVSHVLPALGVEHVRVRTYADWAGEQRRRHLPRLPAAPREDTPSWVQRIKLHAALGAAWVEHVRRNPGPATPEQVLDDWASVLTHRALLEEHFEGAPGAPSAEVLARFCDWNARCNEELFALLGGDEEGGAALDPEDDTLLLRAWQLRVGPLLRGAEQPLRYRHVAVDEVQDFSPLEVQVLVGCLDERRSLTLSGDAQQHIAPHGGFTSWSAFLADLGLPGAEVETLQVSYRSTRQIMGFAQALLGDLAEPREPRVQRSGPAVELFRFTDSGACVAFLADALRRLAREEPLASVALLTPSRAVSDLYHRGLAHCDLPALRRVEQQDFTFAPGIEVTEIEQARGLEFDYVVLVEASAEHFPDAPAARRLLHVGATRAVHQLWLTSVATPSPLLSPASLVSGADARR
jgi:DNA helicase-2/ATP-dependent DNA helicase PcrA